MRYPTVTAASYCGTGLHARTTYAVVLDPRPVRCWVRADLDESEAATRG